MICWPKWSTRQTIHCTVSFVSCFFVFFARSDNSLLIIHFKSITVHQVFIRTANSSLCTRRLSYRWLVQSCPNRKVKLDRTRKRSLAHPLPWQPRQTPNQSSWRLRQNCRFWSHRHSFKGYIYTQAAHVSCNGSWQACGSKIQML